MGTPMNTEEELRKRLDLKRGQREKAEAMKNAAIDAVFDASVGFVLDKVTSNSIAKKLLGTAVKGPSEGIKEALHEASKFHWGPSILDSVDQALPEYREAALQKLAFQLQSEDLIKNFKPVPEVTVIDLGAYQKPEESRAVVKANLQKVGLTASQSDKVLKDIEARFSRNLQKGLDGVNQRLVEIYKKIDERGTEEEVRRAWETVGRGADNLMRFAREIQSPELQTVAGVIQAGLAVKEAVNAVSGFSQALAAIGPMAILGPMGMIAGALLAIYSLFSSSGPNPHQIILDQLQGMSRQLNILQRAMCEGFNDVQKLQLRTLNVIVRGFNDLKETLTEQIAGLSLEFRDAFQKIIGGLDYTLGFIRAAAHNQYLQPLQALITQSEDASLSDIDVRACTRGLEQWLLSLSGNEVLNGRIIRTAHSQASPLTEEQTLKLLQTVLEEDRANGLLAWVLSLVRNTSNQIIVNPLVWQQVAMKYIDLQKRRPAVDTDPDDSKLEQAIRIGKEQIELFNSIRDDQEEVWNPLYAEYQRALEAVQRSFVNYGDETSRHVLHQLNSKRASEGSSGQRVIERLNILAAPNALVDQFNGRTIDHIPEIRPGKIAGSELDPLPRLTKSERIYNLLLNRTDPHLLAAEFLQLKRFAVSQNEVLEGMKLNTFQEFAQSNGRPIKEDVYAMSKMGRGKDAMKFNAHWGGEMHGWQCKHRDSSQQRLLWRSPSEHILDPHWLLKLVVQDNDANPLFKISYTAAWARGEWNVEENPVVTIFNEEGGIFAYKYVGDERLCFHTLTDQGRTDFLNSLQRFVANWWNNWSSSDDRLRVTLEPCFSDTYRNTIIELINNFYKERRVDIARELANGKVSTPASKQFQDNLLRLDIAVAKIKALAYWVGKDIRAPLIENLVTSGHVRRDLTQYCQGQTFVLSLPSVENARRQTQFAMTTVNNLALPATHPRGLLIESLRCLQAHLMRKEILRTACPLLTTYVDIKNEIAKTQSIYFNLFYSEAYEWYKELLAEASGFAEALAKVDNPTIDPILTIPEYRKARTALWRWSLDVSRRANATGGNKLESYFGKKALKSLAPIMTIISPKATLTPKVRVELKKILEKGVEPNILLLAKIAATSGAKIPEKLIGSAVLCNPALWHDGAQGFVRLLMLPNSINLTKKAGYSDETEITAITEMAQRGWALKQLSTHVGLSETLFINLFDGYLQALDKLGKDNLGVIWHRLQTGASDLLVSKMLEDSEDSLSGQVNECIEEMATYRLLIHAFIKIGFAYEPELAKDASSRGLNTLVEDLRQYLKSDKEGFVQQPLLNRINAYRAQVIELRENLVKCIKDRGSIYFFANSLDHYFDKNWPSNILEVNPEALLYEPITPRYIEMIDGFLTAHPYVNTVNLTHLEIDENALRTLAQILKHHPQIRRLSLNNMRLQGAQLELLLPIAQHVQVLDLSYNEIGNGNDNVAVANIIEKMSQSTTLQALDLRYNRIHDIAELIKLCKKQSDGEVLPNRKPLLLDLEANKITAEQLKLANEQLGGSSKIRFGSAAVLKAKIARTGLPKKPCVTHFATFLGDPRTDALMLNLNQAYETLMCRHVTSSRVEELERKESLDRVPPRALSTLSAYQRFIAKKKEEANAIQDSQQLSIVRSGEITFPH